MPLSRDIITGISIVGVAGITYLYTKYKCPSTKDFQQQCIIDEDLEDDTDNEQFYDAESGSHWIVSDENKSKSLEELYKNAVKEQDLKKLQHNFEELNLESSARNLKMSTAVQNIRKTIEKQELTIDTLKSSISDVKTILNTLLESINMLSSRIASTERYTENPSANHNSCKLGLLKTRISILEREVTNNSSKIIGMNNYTSWALMFTGIGAAAVNTHARQPTTPSSSDLTLTGSAPAHIPSRPTPPSFAVTSSGFEPPAHSAPRPPPPPASVPSGFMPSPPSPPPLMMQTTGTPALQSGLKEKTGSAKIDGDDKKAAKSYYRIQITEYLLKSVVLKPPGQRMAGKRI